jgi:3',5'-cyclic AMP phosphodiesterase CpdA
MPVPHHIDLTSADLDRARESMASFSNAVTQTCNDIDGDVFVLAWMSDMHIHAPSSYDDGVLGWAYNTAVDCSANMQLALTELAELKQTPDLVVFGGDLTDRGFQDEYLDEFNEFGRLLDGHLQPDLKTLAILGNHDHVDHALTPAWHDAFNAVKRGDWPDAVEDDDYYYSIQVGDWRFIGLDSRQGQPVTERQRNWLSDQLDQEDTQTVILVHRPLTSCGNWVDDYRLKDRPLFDVIDRSTCVRALISGHTHRTAGWDYRGKTHLVMPSLAYGIPDSIGWGVTLLTDAGVAATFTKNIAIAGYYDCVSDSMQTGNGDWHRVEMQPYSKSMTYNPCMLPR